MPTWLQTEPRREGETRPSRTVACWLTLLVATAFAYSSNAQQPWTDGPVVVAGETPIKAVHVQEVAQRIDALRQRRGLAPGKYTSLPFQGEPIRASHFAEAISAPAEVYRDDGIPPPVFERVAPGEPLRAATINALRAAIADRESVSVTAGVSMTANHQILVELLPDDTAPPNLFDLSGQSLVFTPDGHGRYSRAVRPLAWEEPVGPSINDGAEIALEGFAFDFAGRRWGSFHVSRHGVLTFGARLCLAGSGQESAYWGKGLDARCR